MKEKTMARYKAAAKLYVDGRLVRASEEFESNDQPGSKWIPLDDAAKEKVGTEPRLDRRNRPIPVAEADRSAAADAETDRAARTAPKKRGRKAGHKRASPGKSVAEQHSLGEEPTVGKIHDNE